MSTEKGEMVIRRIHSAVIIDAPSKTVSISIIVLQAADNAVTVGSFRDIGKTHGNILQQYAGGRPGA